MTIRNIFVDIGMVLVGVDLKVAFDRVSSLTGLNHAEINIRLVDDTDILAYERGELTTAEFYRRLSETLGMDITLEEFKQIWRSVLVFDNRNGSDLLSEQLFHQLKRQHRLIALSNTNEMQFEYIADHHPVVSEFHQYVLSYQVGYLKPDPQIYQHALSVASCQPQEALFIDDLEENVEAARELGIQGIRFEGEQRLREELTRLDISL